MFNESDQLNILRKIVKKPLATQRQLATELGLSLGKLNYCLKSLKRHGLIKITNFKKSKDKWKYAYVLTPQGLKKRTDWTISLMKRKMKEYDELRKEMENK